MYKCEMSQLLKSLFDFVTKTAKYKSSFAIVQDRVDFKIKASIVICMRISSSLFI